MPNLWPYWVFLKALSIWIKRKMQNGKSSCGISSGTFTWAHFYISNFQRYAELWIKWIRVRYTEFITLLSISKGSVALN